MLHVRGMCPVEQASPPGVARRGAQKRGLHRPNALGRKSLTAVPPGRRAGGVDAPGVPVGRWGIPMATGPRWSPSAAFGGRSHTPPSHATGYDVTALRGEGAQLMTRQPRSATALSPRLVMGEHGVATRGRDCRLGHPTSRHRHASDALFLSREFDGAFPASRMGAPRGASEPRVQNWDSWMSRPFRTLTQPGRSSFD